ncbi:PDGLE domain-containing protein [Nocardioides sp. zg-536]|uniref:PDGLE domain-containing protein n=1 Tax=Nocardioides faecalis TaxID=2803858 RepID=A0A938Y7S7_9ACTN|nr:PDGLE domain-containing protein [Nocardioides faecalis]MBM9460784.1 PDGLE domain-containing protein [Nocardioides faecalis]QVI57976.1 PDGLE domain-containing protein [Nocardioides faecalis]
MSTSRRFWVVSLLVVLLVAGVASYYASSHPDGLEYVAEKTGFIDSADEEPVTIGSPFEDYGTAGVENGRLSGGIAGVAGVVLTLLIGGGLFWVLRRRGGSADDVASAEPPASTDAASTDAASADAD